MPVVFTVYLCITTETVRGKTTLQPGFNLLNILFRKEDELLGSTKSFMKHSLGLGNITCAYDGAEICE